MGEKHLVYDSSGQQRWKYHPKYWSHLNVYEMVSLKGTDIFLQVKKKKGGGGMGENASRKPCPLSPFWRQSCGCSKGENPLERQLPTSGTLYTKEAPLQTYSENLKLTIPSDTSSWRAINTYYFYTLFFRAAKLSQFLQLHFHLGTKMHIL